MKRTKVSRSGSKNLLFGYFGGTIFKNYCHIWNQKPRICLFETFYKNTQKCVNLGPKIPYLRFSRLECKKNYFRISNQYPRIFLIKKFCEKMKKYLFLGQKILLSVYIGARNFRKLMSYCKSAHSNLSNSKTLQKNQKYLILTQKVAYLNTLEVDVLKAIVIFEIKILQFFYLQNIAKKLNKNF